MSITVTSEEIEQFRAILGDYPDALVALDEIEVCDGDLEDAAINLGIQVGQQPDTSDRWIEGLAKRWRHVICQPEIKEKLEQGLTGDTLLSLTEHTTLPLKLATPIAIYVVKAGLQNFCQSFEAKIR
ncbi:MAG: hypothetical protein K6T90_00325 [Leptolyngbyaceae cyanobacterium HOT.MB2.61]|jgi:hypothetical protein|nr:hypothetical protein [Leptolyngbyaceae cyanobacterium HOT.MB2.61]